jgi:hypothetical protein
VTEPGKLRSPNVVAKCYQLTAAVLRSAVSNRSLAFNPCEDIRLPPRRRHDSDERIITREELMTVLLPVVPIGTARSSPRQAVLDSGEERQLASALTRPISINAVSGSVRTVIKVGGQTSFKPFPKSAAADALCRSRHGWLRSSGSIARVARRGRAVWFFPTRWANRCVAPCFALVSGGLLWYELGCWVPSRSSTATPCGPAGSTSPVRSSSRSS